MLSFFFFNDTATTEIYTLSLHDALPIFCRGHCDVSGLVIIVCLLSRQASWTQGFRARLEQSHNSPFPVSPGLTFAAVFWLVKFSDFQTFQQSLSRLTSFIVDYSGVISVLLTFSGTFFSFPQYTRHGLSQLSPLDVLLSPFSFSPSD